MASPLLLAALAGCAPTANEEAASTSLYALVEGIDGVYFYPPLGPEPQAAGSFDATLLDGLSVSIEMQEADGSVTTLGSFDRTTHPAVALLAEHERYWVNIPAATYLTDRARTYQVRAFLDGSELGTSVLSDRIFDVMAWNPDLPIGVTLRIEGTGAVRNIPRTRASGTGRPAHCGDGVRNKDETGVDCGGSQCAPCQCNTASGTTAAIAECGWYYDAGLMSSCQATRTAQMTAVHYVLVGVRNIPYPTTNCVPYCWLPLWDSYWCPSSSPRAVQQANGSYRCYPQCPAGTTLVGDRCVCN